ncbi:MAG: putative universal stress protein [Deltaproteobacteria bacterium]|nr:putative universal stress protein [Deltaproteobacteria bacterium]
MNLVWAFNPFDDNRKLQQKALVTAKALLGARDQLEAVYVASPNEIALSAAFDVPVELRFSEYPKGLVEKAVRKLGSKQVRATVLPQRELSLTASARLLAAHLVQSKAELALVASHARKGVSRLVLGSFAEALVHAAKTDLLVFHEASRVLKQEPKILLFAHDLSEQGDRGFEKALRYAKKWKCALHVIHVPAPSYGLHFDDQDKRVEAYRKDVGAKIRRIEAALKRARVGGSVVIDAQWAPISELILARVEQVHADLLLVLAKSGRLAGFMGGSVTRQLLRASVAPVLVLKLG